MTKKINAASFVFLVSLAGFLSAAKLEITDNEIDEQEKCSRVQFPEAFKAAMTSFCNNSEHDESLLALVMELEPFPTLAEAKIEIDNIINDENTVVKLVKASDPMPPYGEDIAKNWIFSLAIEDTDTIFYAIVSRLDAKDTYNYGFN